MTYGTASRGEDTLRDFKNILALREFCFLFFIAFAVVVFASPLAGEGRVRGLAKSIIQKQLNDTTTSFALRDYALRFMLFARPLTCRFAASSPARGEDTLRDFKNILALRDFV